MQPDIHWTVTGQEFQPPSHTPQAAPVLANEAAAEVPRYIKHYESQVYQWSQMINAEDILKQQLL